MTKHPTSYAEATARQVGETGGLLLHFLTANPANRANFSWMATSFSTAKEAKGRERRLGLEAWDDTSF
jgi:hypothetical protein